MADVDLLVLDRDVADGPSPDTRFGGLPSVERGDFAWPVCRTCGETMQFLGQVRRSTARGLHLVFMCRNDTDDCSPWEADGGANAVRCVGIEDLVVAEAPLGRDVTRGEPYGARIEHVQAAGYDEARTEWAERSAGRRRETLGQVGGETDWLNGDETPGCDHCGERMSFVAQLETGPDYATEMNFAGGCGYLFECECAGCCGKFLWQS